MFNLEQIKNAHAKVKSGADFPAYIREIKTLGVTHYNSYVQDGNAVYFGNESHQVATGAKYETLEIDVTTNKDQFIERLKAHQRGETDYPTFCKDCARNGVEFWKIDLHQMTCTYFDTAGNELLVENIPH